MIIITKVLVARSLWCLELLISKPQTLKSLAVSSFARLPLLCQGCWADGVHRQCQYCGPGSDGALVFLESKGLSTGSMIGLHRDF